MQSIFEEHRKIIAGKTGEYQEALLVRIEKFQHDLTVWEKQGDEMQYWGNVDEIFRYQKKAVSLENRLIGAIDTIDRFNEEEQMFGWQMSQYPLRKKVRNVKQTARNLEIFNLLISYFHEKSIKKS